MTCNPCDKRSEQSSIIAKSNSIKQQVAQVKSLVYSLTMHYLKNHFKVGDHMHTDLILQDNYGKKICLHTPSLHNSNAFGLLVVKMT